MMSRAKRRRTRAWKPSAKDAASERRGVRAITRRSFARTSRATGATTSNARAREMKASMRSMVSIGGYIRARVAPWGAGDRVHTDAHDGVGSYSTDVQTTTSFARPDRLALASVAMGCARSRARVAANAREDGRNATSNSSAEFVRSWELPDAWDARDGGQLPDADVARAREIFWDTCATYGGDAQVWGALKAACESAAASEERACARAALEMVLVSCARDLSECYDERGWRYVLPAYVRAMPRRGLGPEEG